MKASFDRKSLLPKIELEEKDIEDAAIITAMINSPAWKRLEDYWEVEREAMLDRIKSVPKGDSEIIKTALLGQALNGFDEATKKIPYMLVERIKEYEESLKENNKDEENNFTDA